MELKINFPTPKPKIIVLTNMMAEMINRTLSVHTLSPLVVWYGQSRIGKTTTAQYMAEQINLQFEENNPNSFRAIHYQAGKVPKGFGNEIKRGLLSFHQATLECQMDKGFYLRNPPEVIAAHIVHGLRRKRVQLVLVDEAGDLSLEYIRGIVLVRDTAELMSWTLSIVFIGMNELPGTMTKEPRIHKRIHDWCYFSQYTLDDTWALLKKLHPYFESLDGTKTAHREQVQVIHELCEGLPGLIVPFIHKLDYRLGQYNGVITPVFLRAVYAITQDDMINSLKESRRPYEPFKAARGNKQPVNSTNGGSKSKGGSGGGKAGNSTAEKGKAVA